MLDSGYVRIYRSFLSWEWYDDANTMRVFLHLILTANWEPKKWHGITIERGQRVYSRSKLAAELKMSEQSVRTAINHLISTGELTNCATPKFSVITVKNYDSYQQLTNESTNCQPSNNQVSTSKSTSKSTNCKPPETPHGGAEKQGFENSNQPANQPTAKSEQPENQPQFNKERNNKGSNIYSLAFEEYAKNDAELLKALCDYANMRKMKKKPLSTEKAVKMLFTKLDKMAPDSKTKIAILNQSVFNNWTGIFEMKEDYNKKNQAPVTNQLVNDIEALEKSGMFDTFER